MQRGFISPQRSLSEQRLCAAHTSHGNLQVWESLLGNRCFPRARAGGRASKPSWESISRLINLKSSLISSREREACLHIGSHINVPTVWIQKPVFWYCSRSKHATRGCVLEGMGQGKYSVPNKRHTVPCLICHSQNLGWHSALETSF